MARTGRPKTEKPKEHILSFRLKEEEFSQIKEYAARYNMTMTQIIEEAVKIILINSRHRISSV